MIRIALLVMFVALLLAASPAAVARDLGVHTAADETCAEKHDETGAPASASVTGKKVPARETRARPATRGSVPSGRPNSPRWHSFLPGMFR